MYDRFYDRNGDIVGKTIFHATMLRLYRDDYLEAARMAIDALTEDGVAIQTKQQTGVAGYWQKLYGCPPNEINLSVLLAYLNGKSARAIADRLGVTINTVTYRLHRGMRHVHKRDRFLADQWCNLERRIKQKYEVQQLELKRGRQD